jgi:microcystin-dependent protein
MATQLQFRRGTTAQNDSFTGAVGEISIDTSTDNLRIHDGSTAGGIELMPAGTIVAFGSTTVPTGWLACDDAAVSRTTYARLFAVVGTNFGVGNGSSTFNVPDLRDRVPLGKGTNMTSMGAITSAIAASAVMGSATKSGVTTGASNTGSGNTGTGNTGTGNTGSSNTGTGTTGTGTTGGGTTGSTTQSITVGTRNVAASAKDSSTASVVNSVNTSGHTHSVPGLSVPGLSIPALTVPSLTVPALSVPALSVPSLSIPSLSVNNFSINTTLPSQVVQYIIKI